MSIEAELTTVLKTLCARTFPDFAPISTAKPFVTYQGIGGRSLRWLDNTAADKRHSIVQINVWAASRIDAMTLARAIEDALCASTVFNARPEAEPISTAEEDLKLYGTIQDFSILSTR